MHKFGWQAVAAGLCAVRDRADLDALAIRADYLNAADDTEAGLPDVLGRSIRTSRRPDAFRMLVTVHALGAAGLGRLVARCCATAVGVHELVEQHPQLQAWATPDLSTVVFRPAGADDAVVADIRHALLERGDAVVGRATLPTGTDGAPQVWLKLTLLHPHTPPSSWAPRRDRSQVRASRHSLLEASDLRKP